MSLTAAPMCGEGPDTLHHRLWTCPAIESQRHDAVPKDIACMMGRLPPDDPLATRGMFRHPADEAPQPCTQGGVSAVVCGRDRWGQETKEDVDYRTLRLAGDGYPDGAFYPHPIRDLGRAGWALVVTDASGEKLAQLQGPV